MNIHWRIGKRRPNFTPICHIHTINVFIKLTGTYRQILHDNCGSTVKFYRILEHIIMKKEKNILKNLIFCPIWIEIGDLFNEPKWTKIQITGFYHMWVGSETERCYWEEIIIHIFFLVKIVSVAEPTHMW